MPDLILPDGYVREEPSAAGGVLIDNRTGLDDTLVQQAVETYFVEHSSLSGAAQANAFQTYAAEGSMLARTKFTTPANVWDEIRLARELADRDDDVRSTMGTIIALAFSDGMENHHPDEKTTRLFNGLARHMNLDGTLKRMYREYLIAQQVTTVSLFQRRQAVSIGDEGEDESMVAPLIGILPAERIRTIGSDMFGNAELAFIPEAKLETWLLAYFDKKTSAAKKAELRRQDPVSAVLFTGPTDIEENDWTGTKTRAWRLNPRMAHRTTAAKDGDTPRPLLTSAFALLEAKRLLNLMDYALLQGGMSFIVVAKKGTDERPALPAELENLTQVVRRASSTGVIVGDHRLSFEILTPDLESLLSKEKRTLLGRKIAMSLLRVPEPLEGAASEGVLAELEFIARTISSDRLDLKRHVENYIYEEAFQRNRELTKGVAKLWFPKLILQGAQYFTDYVLKLRDRGDIPRKTAVEAGGFDWEAGVAQRKRELKEGIDDTMMPAAIPFDGATGPQDNNDGRPKGGSSANGAKRSKPSKTSQDPARPTRKISRSAGETVRAVLDEETGETRRIGELTYELLDEYPERELGRVTALERDAASATAPFRSGPLAIIPVNPGHEVGELRAVRLATGLSVLLGERRDGAIVAKALCFREPEFDPLAAEETALRWGFEVGAWTEPEEETAELVEGELVEPLAPVIHLHVDTAKGKIHRTLEYDANGKVTGSTEEPEA